MDGVDKPKFASSFTALGPLHQREITHDGQIVALVVGDSFEAAREGAAKLRVDYEEQPASASLKSKGTETIEAKGNTSRVKEYPKAGDFEAAFQSAPVKLDAEYSTPTQHHNSIELYSTTAEWAGNQLTVYEPSQNVYGVRGELARQLGMDPSDIRIISHYVGGSFAPRDPCLEPQLSPSPPSA